MNFASLTQVGENDPLPLRLGARLPRADEMGEGWTPSKCHRNGDHLVFTEADGKLVATPAPRDSAGRAFGMRHCKTQSDWDGELRTRYVVDEIDF